MHFPTHAALAAQTFDSFAAIDFETANNEPSSVCSIGVVVVRNGKVAERFYSLIRPEPEYYLIWNTRIHGLTIDDTAMSPIFPEVWRRVAELAEGLEFVAHNSMFDKGCLKAVHKAYGMDFPDYKFRCTCRASRSKLKNVLPKHGLAAVAAHFGIALENHHNALADAEACALIALRLFGGQT
jgi:DNA polymerase III, epsilon subunit and related 3''-5'' exonucleases